MRNRNIPVCIALLSLGAVYNFTTRRKTLLNIKARHIGSDSGKRCKYTRQHVVLFLFFGIGWLLICNDACCLWCLWCWWWTSSLCKFFLWRVRTFPFETSASVSWNFMELFPWDLWRVHSCVRSFFPPFVWLYFATGHNSQLPSEQASSLADLRWELEDRRCLDVLGGWKLRKCQSKPLIFKWIVTLKTDAKGVAGQPSQVKQHEMAGTSSNPTRSA